MKAVLDWKPVDPFATLYSHRVHLSDWSFTLDSRELVPGTKDKGGVLLIEHGPQLDEWKEEFHIGPMQIAFWGDSFKWQAANDEIHTVWSFCFKREIDAIFFKMRWM